MLSMCYHGRNVLKRMPTMAEVQHFFQVILAVTLNRTCIQRSQATQVCGQPMTSRLLQNLILDLDTYVQSSWDERGLIERHIIIPAFYHPRADIVNFPLKSSI